MRTGMFVPLEFLVLVRLRKAERDTYELLKIGLGCGHP